jgi:cell division septation protein DedD
MTRNTKPPAHDEYADLVGEVDLEIIASEYEKTRSESGMRDEYVRLVEGDNVLRFLPPKPGEKIPWVRAMVHRIPGSNPKGQDKSGWDKRVICLQGTLGPNGEKRRCPICDLREHLDASGIPSNVALAKQIRAKPSIWAEVINLTTPDEEAKGIQIFNYSSMIDEGLVGLLTGRYAFNYLHHINGAPVLIQREGAGMATRYKGIRTLDRCPIDISVLRDRKDLSRFVRPPTPDQLWEAFDALGLSPTKLNIRMPRRGAETPPQADRTPAPTRTPQRPPAKPTAAPQRPPAKPAPAPVVDEYEVEDDEAFEDDLYDETDEYQS